MKDSVKLDSSAIIFYLFQTCVSPDREATPLQSAMCGSVAGGLAAAVTTPLDVAKTRIILSQVLQYFDTVHFFCKLLTGK